MFLRQSSSCFSCSVSLISLLLPFLSHILILLLLLHVTPLFLSRLPFLFLLLFFFTFLLRFLLQFLPMVALPALRFSCFSFGLSKSFVSPSFFLLPRSIVLLYFPTCLFPATVWFLSNLTLSPLFPFHIFRTPLLLCSSSYRSSSSCFPSLSPSVYFS